jgi:peptide/nickel transport system substrate-binding protein
MIALRNPLVAAALGAASLLALGADAQTVRFVPHADLKILDTTWTNALITRNHGLMVYDTLFALDSKLQPKPQMVESFTRSPDGMVWSF